MLERLQKKWKVSGWRLLLILITFALGGSLTGIAGKKLMNFTGIEVAWLFIPVYIIVVTIIWPFMVLLVSLPFGQFPFFKEYITKLGKKIGGKRTPAPNMTSASLKPQTSNLEPVRLCIFASGAGSNAKNIIDYFRDSEAISVALIASNKPEAGVVQIARDKSIPVLFIEKEKFFRGDAYVPELNKEGIDLVILAGFLWKIPQPLIDAYRGRIINIHPALLPKFGGKGMYGAFVHEAVLNAGEEESGITIHYVDEHYDQGDIIYQAKCTVDTNDSAQTLAAKIHELEYEHFPRVIEKVALLNRN